MQSDIRKAGERKARRKLSVRRRVKLNARISHRVVVTRSLKHISAQIVDDGPDGRVILGVSSQSKALKASNAGRIEQAALVGKILAEEAKKQGIEQAVFDRGSYKYHGRVRALADGAREAGLKI
ncbi:MAG: 50S ribosomal protein L18 [Chlamydiae bacterium]|nr:50S ribosomal protein L18 [Chlamydiota bacterium]